MQDIGSLSRSEPANAARPRAFVVMPFDTGFKSVYDRLIMPALERAGYDVKRADSDLDQQNVLKDVIRGIAHADLVIAELTSRNPNVLYELGISHALRRNTVLITQSMDDVPFDLRTYRVIQYSTQFDSADVLSGQLEAIASANHNGSIDFGSPIIDFLPDQHSDEGRRETLDVTRTPSPGELAANSGEEAERGPREGFLDAILSIQAADTEITHRLEAIGASTERIGQEFQAKNREIQTIQPTSSAGVAAAHRLASDLGKALDRYAADLSEEGPLLERQIQQLIDSGLVFTAWLADQDEIDIDQAVANRDSLGELGQNTGGALVAVREFRSVLVGLSGVSRDMARGTGRAITALDRIIGALEQVEAFTQKAVDLLDEKIPPGYRSSGDAEEIKSEEEDDSTDENVDEEQD